MTSFFKCLLQLYMQSNSYVFFTLRVETALMVIINNEFTLDIRILYENNKIHTLIGLKVCFSQ